MTARSQYEAADLRVVTPFRPFEHQSREQQAVGPFDWYDAIEMNRESVRRACRCESVVITDATTRIDGPVFHYDTEETRLMLWILEVSHQYLDSTDFDRDTVFCSPDVLVYGDLRRWFSGDFGMVIRPGHQRPILNSLQFWPVRSKKVLRGIYRRALALARKLPEDVIEWGADSEPFRIMMRPLRTGLGFKRHKVFANLIDSRDVLGTLTESMLIALDSGLPIVPRQPAMDFRFMRKRYMRRVFDATIGANTP